VNEEGRHRIKNAPFPAFIEDGGDEGDDPGEVLDHQVRQILAPRGDFPEENWSHAGIALHGVNKTPDVGPQFCFRSSAGFDARRNRIGDMTDDAVQHRGIQGLLGADVVVDHGLVHTGPAGDFIHPGAVETRLGEDIRGGVKDARGGQGLFVRHHKPSGWFN